MKHYTIISREVRLFLVVGTLTVLIDFFTYHGLIWQLHCDIDLAKAIGFCTGTLFSYIANRFWTFGRQEAAPGSLIRFIFLYAVTLLVNVMVNKGVLYVMDHSFGKIQIAFLVATTISATLNFFGMKWFAFKEKWIKEAI